MTTPYSRHRLKEKYNTSYRAKHVLTGVLAKGRLAIMRAKELLIVVDMQPKFEVSCDVEVLEAVASQIRAAKRRGWPICFLEFDGNFGSTHKVLRELASDYSKHDYVYKSEADGSLQIADWLKGNPQFWAGIFRVCGVNLHCCVKHTANGLAHKFPENIVKVLRKACRDTEHTTGNWHKFTSFANLVVLPKLCQGGLNANNFGHSELVGFPKH